MHYFSECGFTVIQILGFRLEIINRKRNPILLLSQIVTPSTNIKEFYILKYKIKFSRV